MQEKFAFLKSVRFWKLVIIAIVQVLAAEGIIDYTIVNGLSFILFGSVAIKTFDRVGEKIGDKDTK